MWIFTKSRIWYFSPDEGGGGGASGGGDSVAVTSAPEPASGDSIMTSEPTYEHLGVEQAPLKAPEPAPAGAPPAGQANGQTNGQQRPTRPARGQRPGKPAPVSAAPAAGVSSAPVGAAQPVAGGVESMWQDAHYQWGAHYGLTKEQVETFQSVPHFEGWLQRMRFASQQRQQAQQQAPPQQQQAAPAGAPQGQQQQPYAYQPFKLENPDDFEPSWVKFVEHQNQHLGQVTQQLQALMGLQPQLQQILPLAGQFASWQREQQQQATANLVSQIDGELEKIDGQLFGTGDVRKLGPAELNARIRFSDVLSRVEAGYRGRGEALPPLPTVVAEAYRIAFGDRIRDQALSQASQKSQQLRGQTVAAPTSRERRPMTSEEQAIRAAAGWLKQNSDADSNLVSV